MPGFTFDSATVNSERDRWSVPVVAVDEFAGGVEAVALAIGLGLEVLGYPWPVTAPSGDFGEHAHTPTKTTIPTRLQRLEVIAAA